MEFFLYWEYASRFRVNDFCDLSFETFSTVWKGVRPAVTVLIVDGLVNPDWLIEVDVIAQPEQ